MNTITDESNRFSKRGSPGSSHWLLLHWLLFVPVVVGLAVTPANAKPETQVIVEDFSDMVTSGDRGFNDFFGNSGDINKENSKGRFYGTSKLVPLSPETMTLRFRWDFRVGTDREAYTGLFFCLFGLCDTKVTFTGDSAEAHAEIVSFPEHSLNMNGIDEPVKEPGGPRSLEKLKLNIDYRGAPLTLKLELKDVQGGGRFKRFIVNKPMTITWSFRRRFRVLNDQDLDLTRAKVLSLVIERNNVGDHVTNPLRGSFKLKKAWFVSNRAEVEPQANMDLLDLAERRACQYFIHWSSRKTALDKYPGSSYGFPQDRSSFADLLTVGGVGFALPAYLTCAERRWIGRNEARTRTLAVLKRLADPGLSGPEAVGKIGYKGFFYHFLGVDGLRKLNFDFEKTEADESKNTAELSTIDTSLALMGVLAAQSYFDGTDPKETEIRELAQRIYDSVDWPFMLEPASRQFYLGWKPNEVRDASPAFEIDDAEAQGQYSGTSNYPATLDYYTDEASLASLLALGSTTHPVSTEVWCAWRRKLTSDGLVLTYPGSLFTYQFLQAFLDTRSLNALAPCPGETPVDWFANSRLAIRKAIEYVQENPLNLATYQDPGAWGISAAEGPDDGYHAYCAAPIAIDDACKQDGTATYYGAVSSLGFAMQNGKVDPEAKDIHDEVLKALRRAWAEGDWHYAFGLPDAFNTDISEAVAQNPSASWLRRSGRWINRPQFAIDQGPMLLHLENARNGLIWKLVGTNPNIQRALSRFLQAPVEFLFEGENGTGAGINMPRSEALGKVTRWLHAGEKIVFPVAIGTHDLNATYRLTVRYSNDNFGSLEKVMVRYDDQEVGQFAAQDTGNYGEGWNRFVITDPPANLSLTSDEHTLEASTGLRREPRGNPGRLSLPGSG